MDVRDRSSYPTNLETTTVLPPRLRDEATAGASETASFATSSDSSRLSLAARSLAQAIQLPEMRESRVAALREQIASGTYQVSSQDVAGAMLRSVAG